MSTEIYDYSSHSNWQRRGIQPSDKEVRAQFPTLFFAAVRRRDSAKVRSLAKLAGNEKWEEAARPLCDLLLPPSPKWATPRFSPRGWPEARSAAVWALQEIGHPMAHRALVHTLACDPDFVVRAAANAAVQNLGCKAVPSMVQAVRAPIDWRLEGMRATLTGLGDQADLPNADRRAAGMVLMDVLYENFPDAPRRWTRHARRVGRIVGIVTMVMLVLGSQNNGWPLIPAILMAIMPGLFMGIIAHGAVAFLCAAAYSRAERGPLYAIAAQSIVRLNDKRAIPGMLQLAFDAPLRGNGRHARAALLSLLPQINEEDSDLFSTIDCDNINRAIAQQVDPELTLALLHTLAAVGNGSSIPRLRRLIKRTRSEAIRSSAAQTLEILEAREARVMLAQTLLRGTQAPHANPTEMLRSVVSQASEQPEQLLRPVQGEQT